MKAPFTLSLAVVFTIFLIASAGCNKNTTSTNAPANASWVGNYYGTAADDVNSSGGTISDTLRVTASSSIPNQISMFDTQDSIPYTGTVNGNTVSMTVTFPASGGYSAQTISGTGTLTSGVFTGTTYSLYTYAGIQVRDTIYYNMVKH